MFLLANLISLISLINLYYVLGADDVPSGSLPLIWPAIRQDKSYRLMFQLEMFGTSQRLNVEEWASFEKQLFRLDLITGEKRTSYLTNGKTGEIFRYRPFICDQLSDQSKELGIIGYLFKGYSLGADPSNNKTFAYGLGPLWLRSKQDATKVSLMSDNSSLKVRRHKFLSQYNGYEVAFAASENPYNLRMYFPKDKYSFVDAVEWVGLYSETNPDVVEARAKLMYINDRPIDDSIFELPLGYGCQRQAQQDDSSSGVDVGVDILHDGTPNQAVLAITTSRPRDELLNSWVSQRFTVSMLRSVLKLGGQLHSYYVTLTQGIDTQTSRLKRTKRVWSAADVNASVALIYNIDETSGDCTATRMNFKDLIKLPFPVTKDSLDQSPPVYIGVAIITSLFNDNSGYHKLREKVSQYSSGATFREHFYEKRFDHFALKNSEDQMVWAGPMSVVKRIRSVAISLDDSQSKPLVTQYHTTLSLFFYSDDLKRILYKAVIDLMSQEELDINFMQKEIDVSSCFQEEQKENIVIKYPMESQEISRKLSAIEDLIQERFLLNLFGTTSVKPLQVSGLELSFDNFFMHIKMTLIDLPLTQTFNLTRGYQLKKPEYSTSSGLLEKFSSSLDKCVLELKEGLASLDRNLSSDLYQYVKLNLDKAWARYEQVGSRTHLKPRQVMEIFQEFVSYESETNSSSDDQQSNMTPMGSYENVPLRIRIDTELLPALNSDQMDFIELRPLSVHSDMDSMNEFVREERSNYNLPQMTNSSVVTVLEASNLRVQYSILFEARQLKKKSGQSYDHMSFDDCSEMCELNDCRSFSYCESNQNCIVTNLLKTADIKRETYSEPLCSVHILDYLSKFEDFGFAQQPNVVKSVIEGTSKEDCALACMEEQDFNCQGFYYCKRFVLARVDETNSCLLQDKHIEEGGHVPSQGRLTVPSVNTKAGVACRYFSRSYLAQFDEYRGKALRFEMDANLATAVAKTEIVVGLGAESCAQRCIQEFCLAFNVCLDSIDHSYICELAKRQVRKNNLVSRKRCTTFVLSDKSQFNLKKMKLIEADPDRVALDRDNKAPNVVIDAEQQEAMNKDIYTDLLNWFWSLEEVKRAREGSHLISNLVSLLFGSVIGVICAILWIQKDSVYNIVTRITSHRLART